MTTDRPVRADKDEPAARPEWGTEDYRRYGALFNDVTFAPISGHLLFSQRQTLTDYLWAQGWRRDVRPEDVTLTRADRLSVDGTVE